MRRDVGGQLIPIASQRDPLLFTDKFLAYPNSDWQARLRRHSVIAL
jgi:hypothetical protein